MLCNSQFPRPQFRLVFATGIQLSAWLISVFHVASRAATTKPDIISWMMTSHTHHAINYILKRPLTCIHIFSLWIRCTDSVNSARWPPVGGTCCRKAECEAYGAATVSTWWKLLQNRQSNSWRTSSWSSISVVTRNEILACMSALWPVLSLDVSLRLPSTRWRCLRQDCRWGRLVSTEASLTLPLKSTEEKALPSSSADTYPTF